MKNIAHAFKVVACQREGCSNRTVLPRCIPLRTGQYQGASTKGDPYIDVACFQCAYVSRYIPEMIGQLVADTPDPNQFPAQTVWLGVWLQCDDKNCSSHVLVESAMGLAAKPKDVAAFVSRWEITSEVACFSGHPPKQPLKRMWDSISNSSQ